ncbi:MAG: hypothetical protein ACD_22C00257G0004 [uncultured bacterium]|nr:MAG: hypothetical protein ACD_22C00257G0004 [uncultured bacterium]
MQVSAQDFDKAESGTKTYYQPRGSSNDFIKTEQKTSGTINFISSLVSAKQTDDPETLIDIKVTNPLKKVYALLQEIKKHQSTTFSLKFTIPLIALPIFLFAAFQLGKGQTVCKQVFTSKSGVIKNLSVEVPDTSTDVSVFSRIYRRLSPISQTTTKYVTEDRSILLDVNGETINIVHPNKVLLTDYEGKDVIVTGTYSSCTGVMSVVSEKNVVGR